MSSFNFYLTISCILFSINTNALNITIDPGHGGTDRGAVRGNVEESQIVLNVAKKLNALLASDPNFQTNLTRETDKILSLAERVKIADSFGADLLVSLHANAAPDRRAQGIEVFFQNSLSPNEDYLSNEHNEPVNHPLKDQASSDLSRSGDVTAIVQDLYKQTRIKNSLALSEALQEVVKQDGPVSIKQAPFYVISKSNMPSVLIELGFLTHPKDIVRLNSEPYQGLLAKKIYSALVQYKEKIDSQEPQALK